MFHNFVEVLMKCRENVQMVYKAAFDYACTYFQLFIYHMVVDWW